MSGIAPLVEAAGLGKRYPASHGSRDRWRALWCSLSGRPLERRHVALEDVDLCVRPGESLAVVGENGAGKSTLLKLVAGVLRPTSGRVSTRGRLCAMLELGAGFQPEFSGRANARLAATLSGADEREIEELLPRVLEFADIGEAIDQPVKTYSSGMAVRLGFAVNTALKPDLLVTDEVLAVGDVAFQKKCIGWLERFLGDGGTLLLVSHSLYHVQKLCQRALWLHHGRVTAEGDVFEVTQAYMAHHESRLASEVESEPGEARSIRLEHLSLGDSGDGDARIDAGEILPIRARMTGTADELRAELRRNDDTVLASAAISGLADGDLHLILDTAALLPGRYQLRLSPWSDDRQVGPLVRRLLEIRGRTRALGSARLAHRWTTPR